MLIQSVDELESEDHAALEGPKLPLLGRIKRLDQAELGEDLLRRAARVEQEAAEVRDGPAPARLGDVRDDRQGGPDQLITTRERARAAEGTRELGALFGHPFGDLSHEQAAGIGAEHHESQWRRWCRAASSFERSDSAYFCNAAFDVAVSRRRSTTLFDGFLVV